MKKILFALLGACSLHAETPVLDVPFATLAPVVDGDTSDDVWRAAAVLTPLSQARDTRDTLQETTVRALWSGDFLHVAFDCVDDAVFTTGALRHDDDIYKEDVVEIFIDGGGDGRQFIEVQVAPDGTNLDLMYVFSSAITNAPDGRVEENILRRERWGFREWEMAGLVTAARKTPRGWSAEIALPAAQITRRLGETKFKAGMNLRAQFVRYDHDPVAEGAAERRIIQQTWTPVVHGNPHNSPSLFGILHLVE